MICIIIAFIILTKTVSPIPTSGTQTGPMAEVGPEAEQHWEALQLLSINLERRWEAIVMQALQWQNRLKRELGEQQVRALWHLHFPSFIRHCRQSADALLHSASMSELDLMLRCSVKDRWCCDWSCDDFVTEQSSQTWVVVIRVLTGPAAFLFVPLIKLGGEGSKINSY